MRCHTCGEMLEAAHRRCPSCGSTVRSARGGPSGRVTPFIRRCPRCDYAGEGIAYFRRPGHVGLLVGLGLMTSGVGGLVYWLARRKHRVCPNCGLGWRYALSTPAPERAMDLEAIPEPVPREEDLPPSGIERRVLGVLVLLLGVFLMLMSFVWGDPGPFVVGGILGAGGGSTFYWGLQALQDRRKAVLRALERRVLRLATERGGTLTVTEVAAELDLSMPAAEKILIGLDDGFRVRSEITDQGLLLYEFPEVKHRPRLGGGEATD